ncbi:MAG: hypothetical protein M3Q40_09630 [Pseudomonadota bacterium]|nr:hypothetical protein [Pseudomonadota bacterium]
MNRLIAMCSFLLSLYGCDVGQSTFVHRTRMDGADILHSRVVAHAGHTRFECLRSASGQCHFTVLPGDCMSAAARATSPIERCVMRPPERFSVAGGQARKVPGTVVGRVCVSVDTTTADPHCDATGAKALAVR